MLATNTTRQTRVVWTLGTLLLVLGLYLLAYVGGLYANAAYNRLAARGDTAIAAPAPVMLPPAEVPAVFRVPILASAPAAPVTPAAAQELRPLTVSRLVVPSVAIDSKVVEVGWDVIEQEGQQVAVWQVAEYAVGHHKGSANPGEGGNVVLAGHVGGLGLVFRDLFYVQPGEPVILYSNGAQYRYEVSEKLIVDEEGASPEQRLANAQLIGPTDSEVVTLLTCWPPVGPDKFTQRVIVRATPLGSDQPADNGTLSAWTPR